MTLRINQYLSIIAHNLTYEINIIIFILIFIYIYLDKTHFAIFSQWYFNMIDLSSINTNSFHNVPANKCIWTS